MTKTEKRGSGELVYIYSKPNGMKSRKSLGTRITPVLSKFLDAHIKNKNILTVSGGQCVQTDAASPARDVNRTPCFSNTAEKKRNVRRPGSSSLVCECVTRPWFFLTPAYETRGHATSLHNPAVQ